MESQSLGDSTDEKGVTGSNKDLQLTSTPQVPRSERDRKDRSGSEIPSPSLKMDFESQSIQSSDQAGSKNMKIEVQNEDPDSFSLKGSKRGKRVQNSIQNEDHHSKSSSISNPSSNVSSELSKGQPEKDMESPGLLPLGRLGITINNLPVPNSLEDIEEGMSSDEVSGYRMRQNSVNLAVPNEFEFEMDGYLSQ